MACLREHLAAQRRNRARSAPGRVTPRAQKRTPCPL